MIPAVPELQACIPDASLFRLLIPCPSCGAEYCIDAVRPGPCIVGQAQNSFLPICLNCWHKGKKGRTDRQALENWNAGQVVLGIRMLRSQAGLTVSQLADRTGISETAIKQYERHQYTPSVPTKRKLAAALGVTASEI
jgi:DNA-binding XRE family transcriptional regulator